MPKKKEQEPRRRIVELRAKNIKCLKEVALTDLGDIVDVRGDSGQGKTSILHSIEAAFRGIAPDLVRQGETTAEIELRLTDTTINRIRTASGENLMVKQNGAAIEKAKEFLNTICGPTAFRPVEWVRMGEGSNEGKKKRLREQRQQLLEALSISMDERDVLRGIQTELGEDFIEDLKQVELSEIEFDQHPFIVCSMLMDACAEKRTWLNKEAKKAESFIEVAEKPKIKAPQADLDECINLEKKAVAGYHQAKGAMGNRERLIERADKLRDKIQEEAEALPSIEKLEKTFRHYKAQHDDLDETIQDLKDRLKAVEQEQCKVSDKLKQCRAFQERIEDQEARIEDLEKLESELQDENGVDLNSLKRKMEEAVQDREARELQDQWDSAYHNYESAKGLAERFQALTNFFRDTMPQLILNDADLPVKGLGIDDDVVTVEGVPLHLLGTSEQIKVGVQVAAALNPRSGFILIDGAESIGRKDRVSLFEEAERLGLQLVLTYMDPDAEPGNELIIMQDGERKVG